MRRSLQHFFDPAQAVFDGDDFGRLGEHANM